MASRPLDDFTAIFVQVADTLVSDFDLVDFVHTLTDRAATLTNTNSVGVMLTSDGIDTLTFMGASDESARVLELFQVAAHEGPCVDAFRTGLPVTEEMLASAAATTRWPDWAPAATIQGIVTVHAFPMRLRERVIGAMGVFSRQDETFDDTESSLVQALADLATIGILSQRIITEERLVTEQLQKALNSRLVIEQAKGIIAKSFNVDVETAFDMLRQTARSRHLKIGDLARSIVANPELAEDLQ